MAAQPALVSPEEYLRLEEQATDRHEYVAGVVYAMAAASWNHAELIRNLSGTLYDLLRGQAPQPFTANLKVWVEAMSVYYYPDAVIWCGPEVLNRSQGIIDNPTVVFEVLSESTASLDEGAKLAAYKTLPSLRDYILIDSRRVSVRVFSLEADTWTVRTLSDSADEAPIPSVNLRLPLRDIYERVSFRQDPAEIGQTRADEI